MKYSSFLALLLASILVVGGAAPAFAKDGSDDDSSQTVQNDDDGDSSVSDNDADTEDESADDSQDGRRDRGFHLPFLNASTSARVEKGDDKGGLRGAFGLENKGLHLGEGLDQRIEKLQQLKERISKMEQLSDARIAALTAIIDDQIEALTELKATVDSGAATSTVKEKAKELAGEYRTYLLVVPQAHIEAAVDRILAAAGQMEAFSDKLDTRIQEAEDGGMDVTALVALHADFDAKVADAKVQANAALTLVKDLKPDGGDKTILESNTAALKAAREKIKAAYEDLKAAREDAKEIVKALHGKEGSEDSN